MFIQNLDYISPQITLFHNGSDRHSSIISGLLSIILFIFAFIFGYLISIDFLFHKNPTTFYYKKLELEIPKVEINSINLFHYISISDSNTVNLSLYNKNIYSIIGILEFDYETFLNEDYLENKTYWIYDKCEKSDYYKFEKKINNETKNIISDSACLKKMYKNGSVYSIKDKNFEYPYLEKGIKDLNDIKYSIIVKTCKNSTLNNFSCLSPEIIKNSFSSFQNVYFNYFEFFVDVKDYKEPIKYSTKNFTFFFYYTNFDLFYLNFYPVELRTNDGILFDNNKIIKEYKYESSSNNYFLIESDIKGVLILQLKNYVEVYDRTYKKIQDIAGAVDGIIELFIIFFQIINNLIYHDFQLMKDFNNTIEQKIIKIKFSSQMNYNKTETVVSNLNLINHSHIKPKKIYSNNTINSSKNYFKSVKFNTMLLKTNTNNDNESIKQKTKMNFLNKRLTQNYKKISWCTYCLNRIKCLNKNYYIKNSERMRMDLLSEERLFKNYFDIHNLKDELYSKDSKENFKDLERSHLRSSKCKI